MRVSMSSNIYIINYELVVTPHLRYHQKYIYRIGICGYIYHWVLKVEIVKNFDPEPTSEIIVGIIYNNRGVHVYRLNLTNGVSYTGW